MYTSAFGIRSPLLSYRSKVLLTVHGGLEFSIQRSGIVNGFTHLIAFAGEASAVAVAPMSAVGTPKIPPISVWIGFVRAVVRKTSTRTRFACPPAPSGNVTSAGPTDTGAPMT